MLLKTISSAIVLLGLTAGVATWNQDRTGSASAIEESRLGPKCCDFHKPCCPKGPCCPK